MQFDGPRRDNLSGTELLNLRAEITRLQGRLRNHLEAAEAERECAAVPPPARAAARI